MGEKPVGLSKYTLCTLNEIIEQMYFLFQKNVQYSPTLPNDYNRLEDIQLLFSNCILLLFLSCGRQALQFLYIFHVSNLLDVTD